MDWNVWKRFQLWPIQQQKRKSREQVNAPRLNNTEFIVQISAEQNEYVSSADECQFLAGFV